MIIFSPRSNNSLFPVMWMLRMAEETKIFWILFRPLESYLQNGLCIWTGISKDIIDLIKNYLWPTTPARESGRLPPDHSLLPLSSNLILSPSQSALSQSTCCSLPSLASLPSVSSGSHIFRSNLPVHCSCYLSPQLQVALLRNPPAKPDGEASRSVEQVGELQIFTFPLLLQIPSPSIIPNSAADYLCGFSSFSTPFTRD